MLERVPAVRIPSKMIILVAGISSTDWHRLMDRALTSTHIRRIPKLCQREQQGMEKRLGWKRSERR